MWNWLKWILIGIIVLVIIFMGYNAWRDSRFKNSMDDKFITAVPIDLSQIYGISFFRSCMGHDYSGTFINGIAESNRSMKHYVMPLDEYRDSNDKVRLYAPFDGEIVYIESSKSAYMKQDSRMGGYGVSLAPDSSKTWSLEYGHVYILDSLKPGSKIKAGELIGYAYVMSTRGAFDLALWDDRNMNRRNNLEPGVLLDSIFNHMADDVLNEFAKYGVTKDNVITTKEFRDANPCINGAPWTNVMGMTEVSFIQSEDNKGDIVELKR